MGKLLKAIFTGGIANLSKSEKKRRADVLSQVRREFPGPKNCTEATNAISKIQGAGYMAESQRLIDADPGGSVAPRYLQAYTTVLNDYIDYYNKGCLVDTPSPGMSDPVLGSAVLPTNTGTPGSTSTPGIVPGVAATGNTVIPAAVTDAVKKVPSWAWWAIGGTVLLIAGVLIFRKKGVS